MREPNLDRMRPDAFLAWQVGREGLFELVDGVSRQHDFVKVNMIGSLGAQLRGTPYRVVTGHVAMRTAPSTFRRPDLMVADGPIVLDAHFDQITTAMAVAGGRPCWNDYRRSAGWSSSA